MPESLGIAKHNESATKAAKAKRIAIGTSSLPATRSNTISLPKKKKVPIDKSPLEWYRLTEITMHVLNAAVIKNVKEQRAGRSKANPDEIKILELESKIHKIIEITRDAKNFDSIIRMQQLLEEYSK